MGRAPCCDKSTVKKGPWSPEEDAVLKSHIELHGTGGNWIALPQKIGLKRCGKSCRLRWLNYLRPNIKHGGFTEEEDNLICSLHMRIGSRWSIIASQLPGRTDNDIKNYWNTKLKKKLQEKQRTELKRSLDFKQHTDLSETSEGNNINFLFSEFNQTLCSFPDQSANFTMQESYGTAFSQESNMDPMNVLAAATSSSSQNYNTDFQEMIPGMENLEEMIYGNMGQGTYYGTEMMNNVMSFNSVGYPYDNGIFHDGVGGISEDWSYTGVNLANIGQ